MVWEPIVEGGLADEARTAVLDVARSVASGAHEIPSCDAALFWAYVAGAFEDDWIARAYDDAVDAVGAAATRATTLGLFGGLAGVGFAIAHISEPGSAEGVLASIDAVIADALAVERWTGPYDLIEGLVGVGVYLLERGPAGRGALDRVVAHLAAMSVETEQGTTWFTAPELLPPRQRARCPAGFYNCGLAHGVPGVIAVLARIAALPGADGRARILVEGATRWLAAQRGAGGHPAWLVPGVAGTPARTAWCYGDPGVAVVLLGAARRLGIALDDAVGLARAACSHATGVVDPGLCHGAAGLAHMYGRAYHATGDPELRRAARSWIERTLAMRRPDGVGGFAAWTQSGDEPATWHASADLLEGATGVALALLAACSHAEPAWDRMLLCDA